MAHDQKAILAVILAVKRGFVSPEEGMQILEQAESGADPDPEATLFGHVPAAHHEEIKREAITLANDTDEAARILDEAGVSPSVHHTLLSLGRAVTPSRSDVENTLISIAPAAAAPARDTARLNVGEDRYKLLREHARGGMGRILVAMDTVVGREVALKELLPMATGSGTGGGTPASNTSTSAVARFLREATVTGQLEHPNIVPVYEIGKRDDGSLYYTMKFVKGRTLATRLRAIRSDVDLDPQEKFTERMKLLDAFVDICNAIAFAHSRGVIHRDLKPANIMLGDFGEALVLDWGLARVKEKDDLVAKAENTSHDSADLTMEGEVMGTPAYMAPEQAAGKLGEVDERSDVYALGAVLYEIVSGEAPYHGNSAKQVLSAVLNDAPRDIDDLMPEMPPELAALVMRAIERDPAERFQTARELAEQVQAYRDGRMLSVYNYSTFEIAKRFVKKHRGTVSVGALALLLLLVGGIYSYQNVTSQRDAALRAESEALAQKTIASEQAIEAQRQKRIAEEQATEAGHQRTVAEKSAQEAREQRNLAESRAQDAAREKQRADREARQAEASELRAVNALQQARRNLAEGHVGYAALAASRHDLSERVVHLAAAHNADPSVVGRAELVTALNESAFPHWRSHSYVDLPAGAAVFTEDRRLCAAPLLTPHLSIDEFINRQLTEVFSDIGVWDVATGTLLHRLHGGTAGTWQLIFNPEGTRLAASQESGQLHIWDLRTGEQVLRRTPHTWGQVSLAAAPGSDLFYSSGTDGKIQEWSFTDASARRAREFKGRRFSSLAIAPDGNRMLGGTEFGELLIWDFATTAEPLVLRPGKPITVARFSPAGLLLAFQGGALELWSLETSAPLRTFTVPGEVTSLSLSHDGARAAVTTISGRWVVLDLETSTPAATSAPDQPVLAAVFSPDAAHVIVVREGLGFDFLALPGESLIQRAAAHTSASYALDFSPDSSSFASGGGDGRLVIRRAASGEILSSYQVTPEPIARVIYSPDGTLLLVYTEQGTVLMVEVSTGQVRYSLRMLMGPFAIKFSPCGRYFSAPVTSTSCHLVRVLDGRIEFTFELDEESVFLQTEFDPTAERLWLLDNRLQVWSWYWGRGRPTTPDGKLAIEGTLACFCLVSNASGTVLAISTGEGEIVSWRTDAIDDFAITTVGDPESKLSQTIVTCSFGCSDRFVACGDAQGKLVYVDVVEGAIIHRQQAHRCSILSTIVSPDGRNVVTASVDGEFAGWRAPQFMRAEQYRLGFLSSGEIVISPDGSRAACVIDFGRVCIFDPATFEPLGEVTLLEHMVYALAFNRDGSLLSIGHFDGEVLIWNVQEQRLAARAAVHDEIFGLAHDHRGRLLVGGRHHGLQVRDPLTLELLNDYPLDSGTSFMRVFPDGRRLLVSGMDTEPAIIDTETGEVLLRLERTSYSARAATFSADGSTIFLPRDGGLVVLHESATGKRIGALRVGLDWLTAIEMLPGDERIVAVGGNREALIFDVTSGQVLARSHFNIDFVNAAAISPDGRFMLGSGGVGTIERWSLRGALFRVDRLLGVEPQNLAAVASVLAGITLENLKAIDLPRGTGRFTWNLPGHEPPAYLQSGLPAWAPRVTGATFDFAADFLAEEGDSRERRSTRFARQWHDKFEGFRFKLVEQPDLTMRRVAVPARLKDETGAYIGEPEGKIDFEAYIESTRAGLQASKLEAVRKASTNARNSLAEGRVRAALYHYNSLMDLQPDEVEWFLRYAELALSLEDAWRVSRLTEHYIGIASPTEAPHVRMIYARANTLGWDPEFIRQAFDEAREAGYDREDWYLHHAKALEYSGRHKAAVEAVDAALPMVKDLGIKIELVALKARSALALTLSGTVQNLPRPAIVSVAEGSATKAAGFKRGDIILGISFLDHPDRQLWTYDAQRFHRTWKWMLATSRPTPEYATYTVWRAGQQIELTHPHAPFEATMVTLRYVTE